MNTRRFWLILGVVVVLTLAIMYLLYRGGQRYSWVENYWDTNKGPYGTFVIHNLLKAYFPGKPFYYLKESMATELPGDPEEHSSYVFIGEAQYLDSADIARLLRFVRKGNTALIASRSLPRRLMSSLYKGQCSNRKWRGYEGFEDSVATLNLDEPSLRLKADFRFAYEKPVGVDEERPLYTWQYVDAGYICGLENGFRPLGRLNGEWTNFVRVKHGEGFFYLHSVPIAFANIQLLRREGLDYASAVFSYLPEGPVYWDRYSKVPEPVRLPFPELERKRQFAKTGPMDYVLRQPALRLAWYTLLAAALLFLIFRARRRQRLIPVLEPNTNTSMEFVSTIGRLYFLQNDHKKLAQQSMKLFLGFLRDRYHLQTRELNEAFITLLSRKSEVGEGLIRHILDMAAEIEKAQAISEQTLAGLHQRIEQFYRTCK